MENIKVSIITVTYNVAKTIEQTINSVLNQTYDNIEYIVIDGLSTDGTWEKIKRYQDYISILIHEEDKGLYDAMNKGINQATGDIIGIINGDDWYEKDAVEKVVKNFDNNVDVVYSKMNIIENNGKIAYVSGYIDIKDIWYKMIPHPTVFVKKSVYNELGMFSLEYPIVADYELMLRFYLAGKKFYFLDNVITNFRKGGLTTKKYFECAKEVNNVSMKYIEYCPQKKEYLKQIEKSFYQAKMNAAFRQEDIVFEEMLTYFWGKEKNSIAIFGAGVWGKRCKEKLLKCNVQCDFFVDNNINLQGLIVNDIIVIEPLQLKNMKCNIIIAMSNGYEEVCEQLKNINNPNIHWIGMHELYKDG